MKFTADLETTTNELDCRAWVVGLCEIGNVKNFFWLKTIGELMEWLILEPENHTLYFHNLKFDGEFIIDWLFRNGYTHILDRREAETKTFTTLISDKGLFYSINIYFEVKGKRKKMVTIYDSLKILNFSVKQIAEAFDLPIKKGEIDYAKERPIGYEPTQEEIDYLRNDVEIVARALQTLFDEDLNKMTQGSNALHDFKSIFGKKNFERVFPILDYDKDIRGSYKGGFTYLSPRFS